MYDKIILFITFGRLDGCSLEPDASPSQPQSSPMSIQNLGKKITFNSKFLYLVLDVHLGCPSS